ncbi:hypothetical protein M7I_3105 [Glarea lozoyensis 74030]|uniref:Uncharacterized protein n=1 Tax=Glarea lozoyensis (strain ATCC 74030 / MF5533) TaxID=1104152 RepID=H0EKK7_GLAL7|nr:hypothetical protein M7I_3105 [Glarea lozoyensis 74030]
MPQFSLLTEILRGVKRCFREEIHINSTPKMPYLSTTIVGLQGTLQILYGAAQILIPSVALDTCRALDVQPVPAIINALSYSSMLMGAFYVNAAYRGDTDIMWITFLGRLTGIPYLLYHGGSCKMVAVSEGVLCGVAIVVLGWEKLVGSGGLGRMEL